VSTREKESALDKKGNELAALEREDTFVRAVRAALWQHSVFPGQQIVLMLNGKSLWRSKTSWAGSLRGEGGADAAEPEGWL